MLILFYDTLWGQPLELGEEMDFGEEMAGTEFSTDRRRYDEADAVVFHLPEWPFTPTPAGTADGPPPKRPGQIWVAWSMECEEHYPLMRDAGFMRAFELTMTYKRDADIPLSYADPRGAAADMFAELRRPPPDRGRQAPLLASFISSSHDRSGRQAYHRELARHLPIDCYGAFMRNRTLVPDLGRQTKLETLPAYKFAIAFENARAEDYVTEKFFDPLRVGCVPVYLGAPNVEDFAPGDRCFIDAADYADPRALADHLLALSRDDDAYASYFEWKRKPLRRNFETLVQEQATSWLARLARRVRTALAG
ncbi:glycosyltransferase family 10 fucosyltransferase [Labrys monachus]|uniref:Alpha-1,3-fucosyltransferase n=1 Tax=Labrys monachus TaxID=217067 RepID=A0ABU0FHL4_9HYPH|nr:glycosyltransferase family 10 fucosyltransferase [Labrys monachus]MDQ0394087.1 hypothetical protein [Labrys monachus]